MGIGGIGIWQLLIILVIVLLLFGTKRLKGLGSDLGSAIKGFKKAMGDKDASELDTAEPDPKKVEENGAEATARKETQNSETKF